MYLYLYSIRHGCTVRVPRARGKEGNCEGREGGSGRRRACASGGTGRGGRGGGRGGGEGTRKGRVRRGARGGQERGGVLGERAGQVGAGGESKGCRAGPGV